MEEDALKIEKGKKEEEKVPAKKKKSFSEKQLLS